MNWKAVRIVCMVLNVIGAPEVIALVLYIIIGGLGPGGDHYGGPF